MHMFVQTPRRNDTRRHAPRILEKMASTLAYKSSFSGQIVLGAAAQSVVQKSTTALAANRRSLWTPSD
jgi:hypothetical protein